MRRTLRRIYLRWMQWRRRHVLATDCWCNPTVTSYRNAEG